MTIKAYSIEKELKFYHKKVKPLHKSFLNLLKKQPEKFPFNATLWYPNEFKQTKN